MNLFFSGKLLFVLHSESSHPKSGRESVFVQGLLSLPKFVGTYLEKLIIHKIKCVGINHLVHSWNEAYTKL